MDEFEKRLKQDAENIEAGISPQLRQRIDASLRGTERIKPVPESRTGGFNIWWTSSLTGLAAAIVVIVLINWNRPVAEPVPLEPLADRTVPAAIDELQVLSPPHLIRTADFTTPLEEELEKLQADVEKARATVRKDIEFTF